MSIYIGIDLGTTQSSVSIIIKNIINGELSEKTLEIPQINSNGDYEYLPTLPSVIYFPEDEEPFIGLKASNMLGDRRISFVKNHMGSEWFVEFSGKKWNAPQISSLYLRKLIEAVQEEFPNFNIESGITVSIPASFTPAMQEDTIKACEIAGIPRQYLNMVHEPIAAALTLVKTLEDDPHNNRFIREGLLNGNNGFCRLLVFDIGGGTLDVALLTLQEEILDNKYRIRPTTEQISPHTLLGGYRFDEVFATYLMKQLNLNDEISKIIYPRLVKDVEQLKKKLSNRRNDRDSDDVSIIHRLPSISEQMDQMPDRISVSYQDMKDAWSDLLATGKTFSQLRDITNEGAVLINPQNIMEPIASIFTKLNGRVSYDQVQAILPVGGMSSIEMILQRLKQLFPQAEIVQPDGVQPSLAIARGAAYHQYQIKESTILLRNLLPNIQIQVNLNDDIIWQDLIPKDTRLTQGQKFSKSFSALAFPANTPSMYLPIKINGQERGVAQISRPLGSENKKFEFKLTLNLMGESLIPVFSFESFYGNQMIFSVDELNKNQFNIEADANIKNESVLNELKSHWSTRLNPSNRSTYCDKVIDLQKDFEHAQMIYGISQSVQIFKQIKETLRASIYIDKPAHFLTEIEQTKLISAKSFIMKNISSYINTPSYNYSSANRNLESYFYIILGSFKQMLTTNEVNFLFQRLSNRQTDKNIRTEILMALGRSIRSLDEWFRLLNLVGTYLDEHTEAHLLWALSRSLVNINYKPEHLTAKMKIDIEQRLINLTKIQPMMRSVYYNNLYPLFIIAYISFKPNWNDFMNNRKNMEQIRKLPSVIIKQINAKSVWDLIYEIYVGDISSNDIKNLLPIMMSKWIESDA